MNINIFYIGILLGIIKSITEIRAYKNHKIPKTTNLLKYFFDTKY